MNDQTHIARISAELEIRREQAAAVVALLDDDATIPFIARYRKEVTGSLDEVIIGNIRDRIGKLRELDKRRAAILKSLEERELLTKELERQINDAETMAELEDIYLPYRPKRRTRATVAKERGLEPLAEILFVQDEGDPLELAQPFVDSEKEVPTVEDALAGARDIIAEWVSDDATARGRLRGLFTDMGTIRSEVIAEKEEEGAKYKDYFKWEELLSKTPSHRLLAMRRGEADGILRLHIEAPDLEALAILEEIFIAADHEVSEQVRLAVNDSYKRLLAPALETEMKTESKKRADGEAIKVFTRNLRELLMAPPLGRKRILAIDPGFRTGCKVVCLDSQGQLMENTTIFPHNSDNERALATDKIAELCRKYDIEVIAIGNGTAGRETQDFIRQSGLPERITLEMVNESGASVYSASEVAREEFPDYDVTVRGAVSIGRRLMDPLAELVKIDPKAIGVGQYQHDVDQAALKQALDDTVMSCVNAVGVELNTASKELLSYVSGLGPHLARNIVLYRNEHGPFRSREELMEISRLGPKAFEQAAGFLRIADAENPLDHSAVHPESYGVVNKMAADLGCSVNDLMSDEALRDRIDLKRYVSERVGMPTLQDILDELARPGRDPRPQYESFSFDESVKTIDDLKVGMKLSGIVTNVTAFGAFVDIGVHQDGLVHVSEMAERYVKDPNEFVRVRQQVTVTVIGVDLDRSRISLSMRPQPTSKS
jgi:uncharacterized protein